MDRVKELIAIMVEEKKRTAEFPKEMVGELWEILGIKIVKTSLKQIRVWSSFRGDSWEDLFSVGAILFLEALQKWDEKRGEGLKTYLFAIVKFRLVDYLRQNTRTFLEEKKQINKGMKEGKSFQEALEETEWSNKKKQNFLDNYLARMEQVPYEEGVGICEEETISSEMKRKEGRKILEEFMETLSSKNKAVFRGYIFLGRTMSEIALSLDLSEARVCQILTEAERKLSVQCTRRNTPLRLTFTQPSL